MSDHRSSQVGGGTAGRKTAPRSLRGVTTLLTGIGLLATQDPELGEIPDAALVIEDGRLAWIGPAARAPAADTAVDLGGRCVLPGFVDSHAHLVFAGDRGEEFAARMSRRALLRGRHPVHGGRHPGGVRRAACGPEPDAGWSAELRAAGRHHLRVQVRLRPERAPRGRARCGGRRADARGDLPRARTSCRPAPTAADYVDLVCGPMLAACAPHARWVDVFCERGAFDVDESRAVLRAGMAAGLAPRLHANQLGPGGRGARWPSSWARPAPTTAPTCRRPTSTRWPARRRWRHCCRLVGVLHPLALPGRPRPAGRRGHRGAGHRLQPRLRVLHLDAAGDRAGGPGDADDAGRGGVGGHRRRRPALRRDDVGRLRGRRAGPTWSCWTRRSTCTWPTGRVCR